MKEKGSKEKSPRLKAWARIKVQNSIDGNTTNCRSFVRGNRSLTLSSFQFSKFLQDLIHFKHVEKFDRKRCTSFFFGKIEMDQIESNLYFKLLIRCYNGCLFMVKRTPLLYTNQPLVKSLLCCPIQINQRFIYNQSIHQSCHKI